MLEIRLKNYRMSRVIIIAEAGVNHNGDITIAKKLIDAAAEAGVDFVKFQTFRADGVASKSATKANYCCPGKPAANAQETGIKP